MEVPTNKSSPLASAIRWVARILFILAIVFIGLWSVEAVEGKVGLGRQILAFVMTPSFLMSVVLIVILIIAWKRELIGGILIALIGVATAVFAYVLGPQGIRAGAPSPRRMVLNFIILISLPLIVLGVLFIISYVLHRPKKLTAPTP